VELTPIGVPNAPGLNSYWLSQIVIALAWRMGGVAGIQALHAVVVLVRLILLGVLLRLMGCKDRRLVLMVVVTLGLAIGHLPIFRPQIIAELLATPLLLIALWPGSFWWRGILLGLLLGVWSISHGSFLIGIVMVGMWRSVVLLEIHRGVPKHLLLLKRHPPFSYRPSLWD
jgi:hypothetical protein